MKTCKADIYRKEILKYRKIHSLIEELGQLLPEFPAVERSDVRRIRKDLEWLAENPAWRLFVNKQCPFANACICDMGIGLERALKGRSTVTPREVTRVVESWTKTDKIDL